jgi:hypothetical protein
MDTERSKKKNNNNNKNDLSKELQRYYILLATKHHGMQIKRYIKRVTSHLKYKHMMISQKILRILLIFS